MLRSGDDIGSSAGCESNSGYIKFGSTRNANRLTKLEDLQWTMLWPETKNVMSQIKVLGGGRSTELNGIFPLAVQLVDCSEQVNLWDWIGIWRECGTIG